MLRTLDPEGDARTGEKRDAVRHLVASVVLNELDIKTALLGVNRKGPVSAVSCVAPPVGPHANAGAVYLIEDVIPLPGKVLLRSRSFLREKYVRQHLSARQIARETGTSHSTALSALSAAGLNGEDRKNGHNVLKGQVPFGYVVAEHNLVKDPEEQAVIRLARQLRASGLSLRKIAEELNRRLVPTKNNGIWQANTVKKILDRVTCGR